MSQLLPGLLLALLPYLVGAQMAVGSIGAALSFNSTESRMVKTVIEVALQDYQRITGGRVSLLSADSLGDPLLAASQASSLIYKQGANSIFGLETWTETETVAKIATKAQVPFISFSRENPSWASDKWPFLLNLCCDHYTEAMALSAIVKSWKWRRITLVYEDVDYAATNFLPELTDAAREAGIEVDLEVALSQFSDIPHKLEDLMSRECRVFIVHTSMQLAARLFSEASRMGMMTKEFAWITTAAITDFLDTADRSMISTMQGVIGIRSYFPRETEEFRGFHQRFQELYKMRYMGEVPPDVNMFHLQVYDTVWAVAQAMERDGGSFRGGKLLELILGSNHDGLSGKIRFEHNCLMGSDVFEVINVVGRSYMEMGFWTRNYGFTKMLVRHGTYNGVMSVLGEFHWPGGTWTVPRGWGVGPKVLRIGVPAISAFPDYVTVQHLPRTNKSIVSGYSIDIFRAAVAHLPYDLPYEFIPYYGTYDSLFEQLAMENFDAVVGDTAILSYRCELAEFTQPYTQSGYIMVVPLKPVNSNKAWIITKPFTLTLWISIILLCLVNGMVIWFIETRGQAIVAPSPPDQNPNDAHIIQDDGHQIMPWVWLSFATLLLNAEKLNKNLSRMVMIPWFFVGLILTSSYTASLSSMLTVQRLAPTLNDIESLKQSNAPVACNKGGFLMRFMVDNLGFRPENIRLIPTGDEYPKAFETGQIKAAFFVNGHAKMFLAKYCNRYTSSGPTFHAGGFGFAFPRGSHLTNDVSEAIAKVFETGQMQKMENAVMNSYNCSSASGLSSDEDRLGPSSFYGLFLLMGFTFAAAFLYLFVPRVREGVEEIHSRFRQFADWIRNRFRH